MRAIFRSKVPPMGQVDEAVHASACNEDDIAAVRLDGKDVPVKLRLHDSLFVPLAKWSMLLTGNVVPQLGLIGNYEAGGESVPLLACT